MLSKSYKIAIIGLGYVGLPLFIAFNRVFTTIGFDQSFDRISSLKKGFDINNEIEIKKDIKNKLTNNLKDIKDCNVFIISVPTPVNKSNKPNLTPIKTASKNIGSLLKKGDLVVYESTVYPGCTEEICRIILEQKSNLKLNKDFYLGYSPERINPGDNVNKLENIIKVVSGSNQKALTMVSNLYKKIIKAGIHMAESIKIAESAKIIENTQRDLNIALINQLKIMFDKLNINFDHVLKASNTKWNFLKFTPGLVGGHCIGVDPYYLAYLAKLKKINHKLILSGRKINEAMPKYYGKKFYNFLKKNKMPILGSKTLILGLAFKENVSDYRNSKIINLIYYLKSRNLNLSVYDPLISKKIINNKIYNLTPKKNKYDYIIIAVNHRYFEDLGFENIKKFGKSKVMIFDIKNSFSDNNTIIRL